MNSKQRVIDAIEHRNSDRVAITFDAQPEVYDALYARLGAKSKRELFDRLNVDTWMLIPINFAFSEEEMAKKDVQVSKWGYKSRITQYESGGSYSEIFHFPLAGKDEIDDLKNYPWPSPESFDYSLFASEISEYSDRAIIGVPSWGPYHTASFIRGMEDIMLDFGMRRDYLDVLLGSIADIMLGSLDTMLERHGDGIDIVYLADDYCSQMGPLFSPDDFRKFIMPYLKKVADKTHAKGKKFLLHVCGAVRPLIPMIIEAGVDALEPIQTRAVGMDPAELKREFGADLCFYGGMDLQQILCKGTVQQVKDEARRLIDILGKGGGYIFGPGHTYIQLDAPLENVLAMYETAGRVN